MKCNVNGILNMRIIYKYFYVMFSKKVDYLKFLQIICKICNINFSEMIFHKTNVLIIIIRLVHQDLLLILLAFFSILVQIKMLSIFKNTLVFTIKLNQMLKKNQPNFYCGEIFVSSSVLS